MGKWIYVFAVSFQVTGGLLLVIKYWFGSTSQQLKEIRNKGTRVEEDVIYIESNGPTDYEFVRELWLSRISFISIVIGYILGIFGDVSSSNRLEIMWQIIICTIIMVAFDYWIANKVATKYKD